MKRATLTNIINGISVDVYATTYHPACSYGRAIWVDYYNNPYCEVENPSPFYQISNIKEDEDNQPQSKTH